MVVLCACMHSNSHLQTNYVNTNNFDLRAQRPCFDRRLFWPYDVYGFGGLGPFEGRDALRADVAAVQRSVASECTQQMSTEFTICKIYARPGT
jgi:hypothetical protein